MTAGVKAAVDRVLLKNSINAKVDDDVIFTMPDEEMTVLKGLRPTFPFMAALILLILANIIYPVMMQKNGMIFLAAAAVVFAVGKYIVNKIVDREEALRKEDAKLVSVVVTDAFNVIS